MICGGGTKSRTRKVLSKSGQNPICAETEELTTCNEHECGFVETIAGGTVSGSKVGLGFRESPLNALWIQRSPERSPDLHYKPAAIDVVEHENGYHAVFIAGKETKRADNVEYIRRIDVTHFTPQDKGGAGAPTNCTDLSRYSADPTSLPVEAAECRIFTSGDGFFAARVGAIELDEEDVGSRFNGATALSAESVDSLLVASSTSSLLTRLDLSEQIRCQSWMTEGLRQWDVSTDGMPHRSSPVKLQLSSLSGSSSQWQLDVTRVVGEFKSLGVSDNYQANRVGDPYTWQKNMMCASEIRKGHSDPTKPVQKTKCCVAKQAEQIPPPEECPMPIQEACASKYKIAMQDYEYALQIIARDLKLGEGIHV